MLTRNSRVINARAGCDLTIAQVATRRMDVNCPLDDLNVTDDIFAVADNPEVVRQQHHSACLDRLDMGRHDE